MLNWQDRRNPRAGGAEVHLHEVFGRIASRGHRVDLLVSGWESAPRRERVDGMEVWRFGRRYTFPLRVREGYRRARAAGEIDLVVEDVNKLPLFAPLWADAPVTAVVPHLFGTTAFREESWPVAATVWAAERAMPPVYRDVPVQAISESTRDDLVGRGFAPERVEVVPPGVDHDVYAPDPGVERFPEPTFLYLGRLKRYKGIEVLFRALALSEGEGGRARLLVAGEGDDRPRLQRAARRASVADRVEFLGWVPRERKVKLMRRAWANLYPSPKEGWGLANVEAAACGTPTVASDSPGLRESVADGRSGFLVPHDEPAAWADRLERIAGDPDLRARLSRGAVEHAGRFSWERTARATEGWLRRAAGPDDEGGRSA